MGVIYFIVDHSDVKPLHICNKTFAAYEAEVGSSSSVRLTVFPRLSPQPETRADLSRRLCADAGCQAPRADQVPTRDGAGADHRRTRGLMGEDERHGPGVWRAET